MVMSSPKPEQSIHRKLNIMYPLEAGRSMKPSHKALGRLQFLVRVVGKASRYLHQIDSRLFAASFTLNVRHRATSTTGSVGERVQCRFPV
jgi:hypothetical protein